MNFFFDLIEMITAIHQGCFKFIKSDHKVMLQQMFLFQINAVVLCFLFIKES